MNEELKEIVEGYRTEGIHISDEEVNEILWLCNRKIGDQQDRERRRVPAVAFQGRGKKPICSDEGVNAVTSF